MRSVILPEFPNYRINEDGTIWSLLKRKFLRPIQKDNDYIVQSLRTADGKIKQVYLHRIVAEAFIPKIEGKNYVDHINGDRQDNRATNLRWCTQKENSNFEITARRRREHWDSEEGKISSAKRGLKFRKAVADETAEVFFDRVTDLLNTMNISPETHGLSRYINGCKMHGHVISYYDPVKHAGYERYDKEKHSDRFASCAFPHTKPLLCITDNVLFSGIYKAAKHYGISDTGIASAAKARRTISGKAFRYVSWEEFNALKATREVIE